MGSTYFGLFALFALVLGLAGLFIPSIGRADQEMIVVFWVCFAAHSILKALGK